METRLASLEGNYADLVAEFTQHLSVLRPGVDSC
jgi:hypothetical protein